MLVTSVSIKNHSNLILLQIPILFFNLSLIKQDPLSQLDAPRSLESRRDRVPPYNLNTTGRKILKKLFLSLYTCKVCIHEIASYSYKIFFSCFVRGLGLIFFSRVLPFNSKTTARISIKVGFGKDHTMYSKKIIYHQNQRTFLLHIFYLKGCSM